MIAVNKLKYLMLLSGVSSQELALATQIERSTLIKILNGSTARPRIDTIHSLAKYFNVDISELIDIHDSDLKVPISQAKELKSILANLMTINGINSATLLTKYTGISASMICDILNVLQSSLMLRFRNSVA
jgi:transcriptional regulator with XRE-family HTH domain